MSDTAGQHLRRHPGTRGRCPETGTPQELTTVV